MLGISIFMDDALKKTEQLPGTTWTMYEKTIGRGYLARFALWFEKIGLDD
jgi:hypothetical protein